MIFIRWLVSYSVLQVPVVSGHQSSGLGVRASELQCCWAPRDGMSFCRASGAQLLLDTMLNVMCVSVQLCSRPPLPAGCPVAGSVCLPGTVPVVSPRWLVAGASCTQAPAVFGCCSSLLLPLPAPPPENWPSLFLCWWLSLVWGTLTNASLFGWVVVCNQF